MSTQRGAVRSFVAQRASNRANDYPNVIEFNGDFRMLRRAFVLGAASAAAVSQASAQMIGPPAGGFVFLPRITGGSVAETASASGSVVTAPTNPLAPISALTSFRLSFLNGDHKIRRIQVLPDGGNARFALNDMDDLDPFSASAHWMNFSGGQASEATSTRGGGRIVTQIPIPAGPTNHTFALRGFTLDRGERVDANIRKLAIALAPSGTAIEVILSDNEGADLRLSVRRTPGRTGPDIGRRYRTTVQYAWIPNALIASTGTITGNQNGRDAAATPSDYQSIIRGFSFEFTNTDHHLLLMEAATADGGMGRFQDNNLDDPMRWQIDYAHLRRPA